MQHLRDLARLRRVRDRIDREYAQPLDVAALARAVHMSAGHLSREFRRAYGEPPYTYLMTRRIERASPSAYRARTAPAAAAMPSCVAKQPSMAIVLHPPAVDPGITDDERRTLTEMMAKGTFAGINLATADLDGTFERVQASGAEIVQEPIEQPYGLRDCAVRDPAGNLIRIQELR